MTAQRRNQISNRRWIWMALTLFGRGRSCCLAWDRGGECKKRCPLGKHHLKPQADLVGGRLLSRDLWLLPAGLWCCFRIFVAYL